MPYIKQEDRVRYDSIVDQLKVKLFEAADENTTICFAGHLNYIITSLIKKTYEGYLDKEGGGKLCYSDYNEIIGMLSCCLLEEYRHIIGPYEEKAMKNNGDVK